MRTISKEYLGIMILIKLQNLTFPGQNVKR